MKPGCEKIFVSYVNCSLSEGPKNLQKIFNTIDDFISIPDKVSIDKIIESMAFIEKYDIKNDEADYDRAEKELRKKAKEIFEINDLDGESLRLNIEFFVRTVFDSVISGGGCSHCPVFIDNEIKNQLWKILNLKDPKCYQCYQAIIINLLTKIVNGINYADLGWDLIIFSLNDAYSVIKRKIWPAKEKEGKTSKDTLEQEWILESFPEGINDSLPKIAFVSLFEFLQKNDRRRIKKCPYCNQFFIAKNIKRIKCYSSDCHKEYRRRQKREQRTKDPVKYY